jgi:plastocyanin
VAAGLAFALFSLALIGLCDTVASAGETAQASKVASVDIDNFEFTPATLTVTKGAGVRFENSSSVTHTATREGSFNTGRIKPGKSALVRFNQKGTFAYRCLIHPQMHGKIVVK